METAQLAKNILANYRPKVKIKTITSFNQQVYAKSPVIPFGFDGWCETPTPKVAKVAKVAKVRKSYSPAFLKVLDYSILGYTAEAIVTYNCGCGQIHSTGLDSLSLLQTCNDAKQRVQDLFKSQNCKVLSYVNPYEIHYTCYCGKEHVTDIYSAKYKGLICPHTKRRGRLYKWKKAVLQRDDSMCVKCCSVDLLQVHHIENYKRRPDLAADINNGITLCKDCHDSLHTNYGYTTTQKNLISFLQRSMCENF